MEAPAPDPGGDGLVANDASYAKRRELRTRNAAADKARPDLSALKNLDASLKKNTSFIKKLKTGITPDSLPSLLADVAALKLEKYLSEVVGSIAECRLKNTAELLAATEVCTAIHQRYADFAEPLVATIVKQLGPPPLMSGMPSEQREKEEASRISRQRSSLRFLLELYLVGLAKDGDKRDGLVLPILRDMFANDKGQLANLPLAVSFAKFYAAEFLPGSDVPLEAVPIVGPEQRAAIKSLMSDYWNAAVRKLESDYNRLRDMSRSLADHAIARGDVSEDRQQRYENGLKAHEKLLSLVSSLADALGETMPELKGLDEETANVTRLTGIGIISDNGSKFRDDSGANLGPWEDEETKFFYENIVDLKDFVPGILLGERQPEGPDTSSAIGDGMESDAPDRTPEGVDLNKDPAILPDLGTGLETEQTDLGDSGKTNVEDELKAADAGPSQPQVDALLGRLANALNRTTIDEIAVEFCYLNTKASRRKLARALLAVPRQRVDLLPYYARLIAILKPYMPDLSSLVSDSLDAEFHRQQRRRDSGFMEEKIKTVRYIGELTKFRVVSLHVAFHCFKVLLDDFGNQSIEILANFLESCGRFLAKSPESSQRMSNMLDIMMRKKAVQHLDNRQVMMIENAFYQCNPPERTAVSTKVRSPTESYIRRLVYYELSKATADKVVRLLRKLDWESSEVVRVVEKVLFKVWKVRFSNVHLLAVIVADLSLYHPHISVKVVDGILEEIRLGLEQNIFKHNQRRIAAVKYLGELYNYRLVDTKVVFDTLYLLLTFGHGGIPKPDVLNPIDAPHDFFRVRLVCTLLETCGSVFSRGALTKRLDAFLVYLQVYVKTKIEPPLDIVFLLQDTFEALRPNARRFQSFEEALEALKEVTQASAAVEASGGQEDELSEDEEDVAEGTRGSDTDDSGSDISDERSDGVGTGSDSAEENVVVRDQFAKGPSKEEDDEFEKELNKILQESVESRRSEKRVMNLFDVAVPLGNMRRGKFTVGADDEGARSSGDEEDHGGKGSVVFSILTKKGNKQQTRTVSLPADSAFAVSTLKKQEADRAEQAALKQLVLDSLSTDGGGNTPLVPAPGRKGKITLWSNSANHRIG